MTYAQVLSSAAGKLLASGFMQVGSSGCLGALSRLSTLSNIAWHEVQQQHQKTAWQALPSARHASSSTASSEQQQQQQQRAPTPNEEAQNLSKAFLTNVLNAEEMWMKGVAGQLKMWVATKKLPELGEKEQAAVVERVQAEYLDTYQRNAAGRTLSHRARSHLKQACLAAATHRVLLQEAPDGAKMVEEFIHFAMGGVYSSFMLGGLKISSWAKRLLLRESSISQAVDTLHTIARDMEGACHCSVQPLTATGDSDEEEQPQQQQPELQDEKHERQREDPEAVAEKEAQQLHTQQQWQMGASLTVDSCMIAEVLQAENVPQLLRYFCCQHNMGWLEAYKGQGVDAELEACIANGDGCCRMTVVPQGTDA